MTDRLEVERALNFISSDMPREDWARIGAALKTEFGEEGFDIFNNWSQDAPNYDLSATKSTWKSLRPGFVNIETVFFEALKSGYTPNKTDFKQLSPEEKARRDKERQERLEKAEAERQKAAQTAKVKAQGLFKRGHAVDPNHPYLLKKGITSPSALEGIKQLGNQLLIPARQNKEIVAVQKIGPEGGKYFGKDEALAGSAFLLGDAKKAKTEGIILAEGFATGASLNKATGLPVLIVFSAYNQVNVAHSIANLDTKHVFIAADNDQQTKNAGLKFANRAADILGDKATVLMPQFSEQDVTQFQAKHGQDKFPSDFNDLHELKGIQALSDYFDLGAPEKTTQDISTEDHLMQDNRQDYDIQENYDTPERPAYLDDVPMFDDSDQPIYDAAPVNRIEADLERMASKPINEPDEPVKKANQERPAKQTEATEEVDTGVKQPAQETPSPTPSKEAIVTDLKYKAPPESLYGKYICKDGHYVDPNQRTTIFEDKGKHLVTTRNDAKTVHDMLEVAKEKGWTHVKLSGTKEFKRQAFIEAESQGISTSGYQPTQADLAIVEKLRQERSLNKIYEVPEQEKAVNPEPPTQAHNKEPSAPEEAKAPSQQEPAPEATKTPPQQEQAPEEAKAQPKQEEQTPEMKAKAASEAAEFKAQNMAPSDALLETSAKADIDSDVKKTDIGAQQIPSEIAIAADKIKQSGLSSSLSKRGKQVFNMYVELGSQVAAGMNKHFRTQAMRNLDTNMDKAINGTALNMPEPIKAMHEKERQVTALTVQVKEQERNQDKVMEIER